MDDLDEGLWKDKQGLVLNQLQVRTPKTLCLLIDKNLTISGLRTLTRKKSPNLSLLRLV